jgi:hypothetical protein
MKNNRVKVEELFGKGKGKDNASKANGTNSVRHVKSKIPVGDPPEFG